MDGVMDCKLKLANISGIVLKMFGKYQIIGEEGGV
jgi:hypothetical protein